MYLGHTGACAYSSKVLKQIQSIINHGKYHKILPPGVIKIIRELRISHRKINISSHRNYRDSINTNNLTYVKITDQSGSEVTTISRIATLTVRSIKNKDNLIVNEINDNNVDIAVITETWLKDTKEDQTWLAQSEFKWGNYNTLGQNTPGNRKGGGITITYRKPYKTIQLKGGHKPTTEYAI